MSRKSVSAVVSFHYEVYKCKGLVTSGAVPGFTGVLWDIAGIMLFAAPCPASCLPVVTWVENLTGDHSSA